MFMFNYYAPDRSVSDIRNEVILLRVTFTTGNILSHSKACKSVRVWRSETYYALIADVWLIQNLHIFICIHNYYNINIIMYIQKFMYAWIGFMAWRWPGSRACFLYTGFNALLSLLLHTYALLLCEGIQN